ncbi:hypothetical protein MTR67_035360 [Solanum verrucosum]|uniref:Uncharacterized protein n=1 Tax=Solanum verrucosum TaxID=315347 RepID=A0AAF0ZLG7_SOLVR|nr:hypothetical protein MTR67_035360 [Solanum verrucosum]
MMNAWTYGVDTISNLPCNVLEDQYLVNRLEYLIMGGVPESPPTALNNIKSLKFFTMSLRNVKEVSGVVYCQITARAGGPWFTTATPLQTSSQKLAKSRLKDRPTVRRSNHGPWSVSVDRDFPYQPLTQTTVDQHGP